MFAVGWVLDRLQPATGKPTARERALTNKIKAEDKTTIGAIPAVSSAIPAREVESVWPVNKRPTEELK